MGKRKRAHLSAKAKRKKARDESDDEYIDPDSETWADSLPSSSLEVLIGVKQLAAQRAGNIAEKLPNGTSAAGVFNWRTLRGINIILEEFMKHRLAVTCPDLIPGLKASEDGEEGEEVAKDVKSS